MNDMKSRPFACADVFRHPPLPEAAFVGGHIKSTIDPAIASVCKNESNCTVFLSDGMWLTTWGQGSHEGHPDQRVVCATSADMGQTWTEPITVQASDPASEKNAAYGIPFVVPQTDRIYVFFFITTNTEGTLWTREHRLDPSRRRHPEHASGILHFVYSDDRGQTWSAPFPIDLPDRNINVIPERIHGWVNHPPQIMPTGEVILTFSAAQATGYRGRPWQLGAAEINVVRCENILTETDSEKLQFTLLPEGPRGIRTDLYAHWHNPHLQRHLKFWNGTPEDTGWSFQEMTVVSLSNNRWLGVGRTYLGSPGYTVSADRGQTWSPAQPFRYHPNGAPIPHPMTMCPITQTSDGRFVLLFTNNNGTRRHAKHLWDGDGRTRNPQWLVVGREIPNETQNGGLLFGEPLKLCEVDDSGEVNLKTGISMPQFFERDGRYFVCYNINKEHILLDEIPANVIDKHTPPMC